MPAPGYSYDPNQEYTECVDFGSPYHREKNACETTCIANYAQFNASVASMCPSDSSELDTTCDDYCSTEESKTNRQEGQCYTGFTSTSTSNGTTPPEFCQSVCKEKCKAGCTDYAERRNKIQACLIGVCPGSLPADERTWTSDISAQQRLSLFKPSSPGVWPLMTNDAPCLYFNDQTNEWEYSMTLPPSSSASSSSSSSSSSSVISNPVPAPSSSSSSSIANPVPVPVPVPSSSSSSSVITNPIPAPSSVTPTTSTSSSTPSVSSSFKDWIWILLVAVVVVLIIVSILYYHRKKVFDWMNKPNAKSKHRHHTKKHHTYKHR